MKAWHFIRNDRKLGYGDGRLVVDGQTLLHKSAKPIQLCYSGLHFSLNILDACRYAPGTIACYVEVPNSSILGDDKGVATSRKVIKSLDIKDILIEFAIRQSMLVYKETKWTLWANNWLNGKDRTANAAYTAYAAANTAAYAAANAANAAYAAYTAANAAYAAYTAANTAAYAAANAAAYAAANDAAKKINKSIQNKLLEDMVLEAMSIRKENNA